MVCLTFLCLYFLSSPIAKKNLLGVDISIGVVYVSDPVDGCANGELVPSDSESPQKHFFVGIPSVVPHHTESA